MSYLVNKTYAIVWHKINNPEVRLFVVNPKKKSCQNLSIQSESARNFLTQNKS